MKAWQFFAATVSTSTSTSTTTTTTKSGRSSGKRHAAAASQSRRNFSNKPRTKNAKARRNSFPYYCCFHGQSWIIVVAVSLAITFILVTTIIADCVSPLGQVSDVIKTNNNNNNNNSNRLHQKKSLGAVVFLAPKRHEGSIWGIDRFCLLLRAIRSVDQHLNVHFGPYPIYILHAADYPLDPTGKDGPYTQTDQRLIQSWAAQNSQVHFHPIPLYSGDALEPNTTQRQILEWRQGKDGAVPGRDLGYTSICRLWSGRIQNMEFLDNYEYYLRMDDDSLLTRTLPFDPFIQMQQHNWTYAFRRMAFDTWGVSELWKLSKPLLQQDHPTSPLPFLNGNGDDYEGLQPYNNFHVSRVDFWRSPQWQQDFWKTFNEHHLFFKYRVGDANVHAIALMAMPLEEWTQWEDFPYIHNSNDDPYHWGRHEWAEECQAAYHQNAS